MVQQFVNKYFYYLFFFTYLFSIVLHDIIGFGGIDEICGFILLLLFFYNMFNYKEWPINKAFLLTLFLFLFYVGYSIWIGSNTKKAIATDLIIQMKPYLAFFCTYQLLPQFDKNQKNLLKETVLAIWILLVPLGIAGFVNDNILWNVMGHPSCFAAAVVASSLIYLYCSDYTPRDRITFLIMLALGIASGRSKFYGFYALAGFMILYASNTKHIKLNFKNVMAILLLLTVIVAVAYKKIELYFIEGIATEVNGNEGEQDFLARFVLYATSFDILKDYFPFGSGLASFATHASGEYYSGIYEEYEIDTVWGLSKTYHKFIADTYYPSLAQFGVAGVLLFLTFWIYILRKAALFFRRTKQTRTLVIVTLIIGYILIENIADATFTSNRGFFMMVFLGLLCAEQKRELAAIPGKDASSTITTEK